MSLSGTLHLMEFYKKLLNGGGKSNVQYNVRIEANQRIQLVIFMSIESMEKKYFDGQLTGLNNNHTSLYMHELIIQVCFSSLTT